MRVLLAAILALLPLSMPVQAAAPPEEDAFGHALALVQILVGIAAHAENPNLAYDEVLAGRHPQANRALSGLVEEMTAGMPPEQRARVASIGQDIASLARREAARAPAVSTLPAERALQARRDLNAMGLRYYDQKDFLDAVKRDDLLAVELFIEGRGVNLAATDERGRSGLEIARQRGNQPMAALLARNLRAGR